MSNWIEAKKKCKEQVVSLDIAKELKEAGYPQEGLWWWQRHGKRKWDLECSVYLGESEYSDDDIVAPTVAELGEALPRDIHIPNRKTNDLRDRKSYFFRSEKVDEGVFCKNGWDVGYVGRPYALHYEQANTEANARARMWLYLKKEGLIKN